MIEMIIMSHTDQRGHHHTLVEIKWNTAQEQARFEPFRLMSCTIPECGKICIATEMLEKDLTPELVSHFKNVSKDIAAHLKKM